jgi:hypothetical protein
VTTDLVRLRRPIGENVVHIQIAYVPQYALMFAAGIWARRHRSLDALRPQLLPVAAAVTALGIGAAGGAYTGSHDGRELTDRTWQALLRSLDHCHLGHDPHLHPEVSALDRPAICESSRSVSAVSLVADIGAPSSTRATTSRRSAYVPRTNSSRSAAICAASAAIICAAGRVVRGVRGRRSSCMSRSGGACVWCRPAV